MSEDKIIHIIPVGFEIDRALYGLIELAAKEIYFLYDGKEDDWGRESRRYVSLIKEKLAVFNFDTKRIHEIPFDPTSYKSSKEVLIKIIEKEQHSRNIYINVSTSTKLCAIASALQAIKYDNVLLYYVVPEKYNLPPEGKPFSSGAKRMEVFSPKGFDIGAIEGDILKSLENATFKSLLELNKIILPNEISKASRAKLSYYVRKLQRGGYLTFIPGKKISITALGMSRLYPPVDDAEKIASLEKVE